MTETEIAVTASEAWFPNGFDYNADRDWLRHSHLEVFRDSIPTYHGRYVAKTLPDREETAALRFGSWCHEWLLGRGPEAFLVMPKIDRRTTLGKETAEQTAKLAESKGLIVITDQDRDLLAGMHKAAHASEAAGLLLASPGITETPFRWTCPVTRVPCKAKPDKFFPNALRMVDVKTASDPSPCEFQRALANSGYARQAAWYTEGARIAFGLGFVQFLFIVIGKEPPHETIVYELDPDALETARLQNEQLLTELAECRDSGQWGSRWDDIQTIGLPRWAI